MPEKNEFTQANLQADGAALAAQIIDKVLRPHQPLRTVVVLEALVMLYRFHAQTLPPHAIGLCSMSLAELAGELLKASTATQVPDCNAIH
ncbi:hypothetical protein AVMA1855_15460 [Acidovorax sp. SUPP1855]|uniref:hypothetical protein n=1 Tax=Acidovorax sp. SUPP1855 TaxID=431774 RepID=UPI0023DE5BAD|nr:hypothetical protein [Acidovorax sp. SUPP1855]GKS85566.1 hypothetical protein AVMA1855_15460 [Acidovorax sp. SUPP1855]